MDEIIRIVVVDDHALFRQSLRRVIDSRSDMEVVADAHNGEVAIQQVERFHPHVVLMDIRMPVMGGIEATREITSKFNDVRVIALSSHSDNDYVDKMRLAGAAEYLNKVCGRKELFACIERVMANGRGGS
jgi:two-component system, NarL family, response regulator DegU